MRLTQAQRHSVVWGELLQMLKDQREILRAKLEGDHDQLVTAKLRGQLSVYHELIKLDQEELPLQ